MAILLHLVEKLNDFGALDMSFGSNDRNKAIKIISYSCLMSGFKKFNAYF